MAGNGEGTEGEAHAGLSMGQTDRHPCGFLVEVLNFCFKVRGFFLTVDISLQKWKKSVHLLPVFFRISAFFLRIVDLKIFT